MRAETLAPSSLSSNSNPATSRLVELEWVASFLCGLGFLIWKWAGKKSIYPLEGCCTSEVSGCTQNTGHVGCCKHTVLIIHREAKQSPGRRVTWPQYTQVSPLGGRKTQAQTTSHCMRPILGSGSNPPLLKCKSKAPLYPQPGPQPLGLSASLPYQRIHPPSQPPSSLGLHPTKLAPFPVLSRRCQAPTLEGPPPHFTWADHDPSS